MAELTLQTAISEIQKQLIECQTKLTDFQESHAISPEPEQLTGKALSQAWHSLDKNHYLICKELSWLSSLKLTIRRLKSTISKSAEPESLKTQYRNNLDVRLKDIEELKEAYIYMKAGYEARIRFYNSNQFMQM